MKLTRKVLIATLMSLTIIFAGTTFALAAPIDLNAPAFPPPMSADFQVAFDSAETVAAPADADDPQESITPAPDTPAEPAATETKRFPIEQVFILGFLIEALVEYGKLIIINKTINWKQVAALVGGVVLAFLFNVDIFALVGIPTYIPYAGVILTGILASRGSNWLADFVKWFQGLRGGGVATFPNE